MAKRRSEISRNIPMSYWESSLKPKGWVLFKKVQLDLGEDSQTSFFFLKSGNNLLSCAGYLSGTRIGKLRFVGKSGIFY